jgi:hypothetical protein
MSTSNVTSSFSGFRIGMSAAIAVRALVSRSMLASNGGFSDITCGAAARIHSRPLLAHCFLLCDLRLFVIKRILLAFSINSRDPNTAATTPA